MRYCSRSRCFRPDPGTKHISVPPRHMTSHMPRISNMISQHYRYRIQHLIQSAYNCLKYNTTAEGTCLSTDYTQMPTGKEKNIDPITTRVQALRRDPPNQSSSSLHVKRRSPYLLSIKNPEKSLEVQNYSASNCSGHLTQQGLHHSSF